MDTTTDTQAMQEANNIFDLLILGLAKAVNTPTATYPNLLRRAMNALSLKMGDQFPKTYTAFLKLCEQSLSMWYPFNDVAALGENYTILDGGRLSEITQDYLYDLVENIGKFPAAARR